MHVCMPTSPSAHELQHNIQQRRGTPTRHGAVPALHRPPPMPAGWFVPPAGRPRKQPFRQTVTTRPPLRLPTPPPAPAPTHPPGVVQQASVGLAVDHAVPALHGFAHRLELEAGAAGGQRGEVKRWAAGAALVCGRRVTGLSSKQGLQARGPQTRAAGGQTWFFFLSSGFKLPATR